MRKLMRLDENIDETVDDLMTSNGFFLANHLLFAATAWGTALRFISAEPENPVHPWISWDHFPNGPVE